jgi:hypothetical protein
MSYFTISTGLRGCYMPDNCFVVRCNTRRELKAVIESEADNYKLAGYIGANKRAIAHIAAIAWKEAQKPNPAYLPYALPVAPQHARDNYCEAVFVSTASRHEYKEYLAQPEY